MAPQKLTMAGAALATAGLLALPPATAFAHTDSVFNLVHFYSAEGEDSGTVGFLSEDKNTAEFTLLPGRTPSTELYTPVGIELHEETGYVVHYVTDDNPDSPTGYHLAVSDWDHTTGETELGIPVTLPEDINAAGELFEGAEYVRIIFAKHLDTTPDGKLLTLAMIGGGTLEEQTLAGVYILEIDPATGAAVPVASVDYESFQLFLFSLGLATDPTTGATWLFVVDPSDVTVWATEIDFSEPIAAPTALSSGAADIRTLDDAAAFLDALSDSVDATVGISDLEEFTSFTEFFGPQSFLLGADFDRAGTLWFHYFEPGPESPYGVYGLASVPGPFSLEGEIVDSGVIGVEMEEVYPFTESPAGAVGYIAVEDTGEQLAETGVASLAPIAAGAVAVAGGLLLLLGRRRARGASA